MTQTARNAVAIAALLIVLGANIIFDLVNGWLAAGVALVAAYLAAIAIDRIFVKRAHKEMVRLYGDEWR